MMQAASDISDLTSYCKATADQLRLEILRVLSQDSFGVLELCRIFDVAQPAMSHHLKILLKSQLVETRRQGTSIYYRRALISPDDPIKGLRSSLIESIDRINVDSDIEARIVDIHNIRHLHAREFFEKHAAQIQSNQDLIAEYVHYADCIKDVLDNEQLPATGTAVEVGPGLCPLILDLAARFDKVVAIDSSHEMLKKTQHLVQAANTTNVQFVSGELGVFKEQADLIVMNMVLHHIASPAAFFTQAKQSLAPSGSLLLVELCPHDQDWTTETCGDLWHGFEPEELNRWADQAGLQQKQNAYLALKNGFQVQVHTFENSGSRN